MNPVDPVVRNNDAGLCLAGQADSWFEYADTAALDLFDAGAPLSFAVLVRPTVIPAIGAGNRRVFQKRLDGQPSSPGFDIFLDSFNWIGWSFEWSDGVNEQTLRQGSVPLGAAPSVDRTDLIVTTIDVQANNAELFVNALLEADDALTPVPVDNAEPIKVAGGIGPAGDQGGNNQVFMAAIWQRVLGSGEVAMLHADPYQLWRAF